MKPNHFTIKISLIFALFLGNSAISQEMLNTSELNQEWSLLKEKDGVKLYARAEQCKVGPLVKPLSYVLMKIVNESSEYKTIYFQLGRHYDQGCEGCEETEENKKALNVSASTSIECDCTFANGELSFLIKNPNYADTRIFQSLELIDLIIE